MLPLTPTRGRGRRTAMRPHLTPEQFAMLQMIQQVRSLTVTPQLRLRARIILLLAQGETMTAIAQAVGMSRTHTYKWVRRWHAEGLRGLQDRQSGYPLGRHRKEAREA